MALKRERPSSPDKSSNIFFSKKISWEKSDFIAAYSPTLSAKALQVLPDFRTATHRIAAWRKRSKQRSLMPESKILYDLGHDDDGEKWAGNRLRNVLNDTGAEGAVVVARWYGGQNIGPIRFTHIEDCAKQAIWNWKVANEEAQKEQASKKQRVEEETALKELQESLRERDENILVLRNLLAEKNSKLNDTEPAPPTPQKAPPDYNKMSLAALQRVDKARDATVAFILKEIDKVDDQLKLIEDLNDSTQDSWNHVEDQQKTSETPQAPTEKDTEG